MNAERIVEILLEGDISPEEFMSSLPKHVLNKFSFVRGFSGEGTKVYLNGPEGQGFMGWIQNMGDNMWYAWRAVCRDGSHEVGGRYRNTKEAAAQDLYDYLKQVGESMDPEEFIRDLPGEFWDTFNIIRDGEHGIRTSSLFTGMYIVYRDNHDANNTRSFIGIIDGTPGDEWTIKGVAVLLKTGSTKIERIYKSKSYASKLDAAKELSVMFNRYNVGRLPKNNVAK